MAIKINPAHKGDLHRALGIPQDKPIPEKRIVEATHSSNAHVRQMANFAHNFRHPKKR